MNASPARRRARFYWTAAGLLLLWLAAQLALQLVAGEASRSAFVTRTIANVVQTAVVLGLAGWLLVTNTNRPSAIHPDDVLPRQPVTPPAVDDAAEERPVLMLNGKPIYGRRPGDNVDAIRMAIQRLEHPEAPLPADAPEWVKDLTIREVQVGHLPLLTEEEEAPHAEA